MVSAKTLCEFVSATSSSIGKSGKFSSGLYVGFYSRRSISTLFCINSTFRVPHHYASRSQRYYSTLTDFRNVKLITFDVTGTLLAFRKPPLEVYQDFGEKYGIKCDSERMKISFKTQWKEMNKQQPHFGVDWEAWWSEFVIRTFQGAHAQGANDTILKKVATELIDHFKTTECWKLKDGAEQLITALSRSELKSNSKPMAIGIISNFDPRLYQLLKDFNIVKFFTPIILSHEHQVSKPNPLIFNLALEAFKRNFPGETIKPDEALHVGDNYELDYLGAKKSGWESCLITSNLDIPEKSRTIVPLEDEVHRDLHSFKEFLERKGNQLLL